MKTAVSKIPASSAKTVSPFFSKERGQGFFSPSGHQRGRKGNAGGAFFSQAGPVQTKLTVGQPGDVYEREADQVADKVVQRMSRPIFESKAERKEEGIQRKCAACEKEEKLQKKENAGANQTASPHTEQQLHASHGGGSALSSADRAPMEQTMGADFSGVRIHTGSQAQQMNEQLNAQAFTHKNDIYFGKGKFDTGSKAGQRLLAHELTHVVQQGGAAVKTAPAVPDQDIGGQNLPGTNVQPESTQAAPNAAGGAASAIPQTATAKTAAGTPSAAQGKATAGGPATQTATSGPATQAAPNGPVTGQEPKTGDLPSEQMGRLTHAHNSVYKIAAVRQAAHLEQDVVLSRALIDQIAVARTKEIRQWFDGRRMEINQFFIGTGQDVLNTIQQKQIQFMQMSFNAMNRVQAFVTDAEQGTIKLGDLFRDQLSAFIDGISNGVRDSINDIAGTITGLISSVHLPDLPGVGMVRDMIVSILNQAASAARGVISLVTSALQGALTKASQMITDVIRTAGQLIRQLVNKIFEVILGIQQTLFMAVQRVGNMILSQMNSFLQGTLWPILQEGEDFLVEQVEEARLIRLMQLDDNEAQVLKAMADVIDPKTKPQKKGAATTSREQRLLYFTQVEQVGVRRNAEIVANFVAETSSFFMIAIHQILAFSEFVYHAWQTALRQFDENISSMVNSAIQKVGDFISGEIDKIKTLFSKAVDNALELVSKFILLVGKVKDAIVKILTSSVSAIGSYIGRLVVQFVSGGGTGADVAAAFTGGGGSALANLPAPQTTPEWEELITELEELEPLFDQTLKLAGEELAVVEEATLVAEEAETAAEVVVDGWEVVLIILIIVLILVIIALVVYLLYLLIEELLKPVPTPEPIPIPEPEPAPEPDPDDPDENDCNDDEFPDPTAPTGMTPADPIDIIWFKPLNQYENPIVLKGTTFTMTSRKPLPPPHQTDTIGVLGPFLPAHHKALQIDKNNKRRTQQRRFKRVLASLGFSWKNSAGDNLSPDHVQDLFWEGPDDFANLWPLESAYNERAGSIQNNAQPIYFRPDPARPCAIEIPIGTAIKRFPNMVIRHYTIDDIRPLP
ncbi:MAG TPA: DUF4157 domain-containing protein [Puia sp.]|nr:DUF4157 domain-containing protein [Puia sp.]